MGELINLEFERFWREHEKQIRQRMEDEASEMEWERRERIDDIAYYAKTNYSNAKKITVGLTTRVVLPDENEVLIGDKLNEFGEWEIKTTLIGKRPIIRCRDCGFEFTLEQKRCRCRSNKVFVDIDQYYGYWRYSGPREKIIVIRDIMKNL